MCGIFSILNSTPHYDIERIQTEFIKGKRRGPEFSKLQSNLDKNAIFGFHRLAINGLNDASNQPLHYDDIVLICNGEIYNYKGLYNSMHLTPTTESDCEVIIHLYKRYGIQQTLLMLDGVFGFVLYDITLNKIYVARDPLGIRPLYILSPLNPEYNVVAIASELKCIESFQYVDNEKKAIVQHVTPGTFHTYGYTDSVWRQCGCEEKYYIPSFTSVQNSIYIKHTQTIVNYLHNAVAKRCQTTERPVACLLSGGLDSSLIAALVACYFRKEGKQIETYSIGLSGSEDIKYAKCVADYIGSIHHEVIVTEDQMFDAIPEVIEAIESYDTTTVRASIGNYLIGKHIASTSDAKVIFNGDGSDELFGGYLYMDKCPDDIEFDKECRRLLGDIYMFDVLRSDKSISSNGLEPRTPFLDRTFVNYVLSIPPQTRNHKNQSGACEKQLLRIAFAQQYVDDLRRPILPDEILWRRKEAFSDGVSNKGRSLYEIIQEKIALTTGEAANIETEKKYYKTIFENLYKDCSHILPYYWMPKYIKSQDPSARTLTIY